MRVHIYVIKKHNFSMMVLLVGICMLMPLGVVAKDLSGISSMKTEGELSQGHRYIHGTVEEVNENTIRVDAGKAGEMSPRYLNLEKKQSTEDINLGDRLRIEVNAQNQVVRFQKFPQKEHSGAH